MSWTCTAASQVNTCLLLNQGLCLQVSLARLPGGTSQRYRSVPLHHMSAINLIGSPVPLGPEEAGPLQVLPISPLQANCFKLSLINRVLFVAGKPLDLEKEDLRKRQESQQ